LQWMQRNGVKWDVKRIYSKAIERGHINILRWIDRNVMPLGVDECRKAVKYRQFALIKYAWNQWQEKVCAIAAKWGDLEALKNFRAQEAPWDEKVCMTAAAGGHLELLKWARAHGAPWDARARYRAAKHGEFKVLIWLLDNGAP
ncbi:MAG: ankyrin repeat domain-containing protein, partial [Parachlamydia sp.]|nr:ankyrin repeat domain-containing protein [Parachlamydia sp.]